MEPILTLGLMSGTSRDGIDATLLLTDGEGLIEPRGFLSLPYTSETRARIGEACARALAMPAPGPDPLIDALSADLADLHAAAVQRLCAATGTPIEAVALIGFHGQTIAHRPASGWTWQTGDAARLAAATGKPVIHDFRSADVAAGGQGAPLAPGYHRARAQRLEKALGVLNLGGVGNLTWFSENDWGSFDTGPANALIDDWVRACGRGDYDKDGVLAASGRIQESVLTSMLDLPWFDQPPPKSLDRDDFDIAPARGLSPADGAATLTAFTAETIRLALGHVPPLSRLAVTGGGRHNPSLMAMIEQRTGVPTIPVEALGWNGDALEAEAFAWLAVRSVRGLPLSWPETTGVPSAMTGGRRLG
jgi:anhydro-N-acetylmuramic acid kinase